eukprot:CAMPEP_0174282008 /NCGR_PEP_ID=MMETSP0809-20121228/2448_1 /TAXON_ID=73025 ORGANISM="Eutreptiella gymnastica-like, Strain CCMP1594" /NCGR_SAMPLE_ID=MMETSP0809 /ASSEMBLY_ACC=CAM_ASM_000658 /LENGTH=39 /DNA_ID= /DNA_START= /DNA_END= /DNA_ORIENTATION=
MKWQNTCPAARNGGTWTWGAFSHSARTAPLISVFIPGTP